MPVRIPEDPYIVNLSPQPLVVEPKKILAGHCFYFVGFSSHSVQSYAELVEKLGGKRNLSIDDQITHIVLSPSTQASPRYDASF